MIRGSRLHEALSLTTALYGRISQGGLFNSAGLAIDNPAAIYLGDSVLPPESEVFLAGQRVTGPLADPGSVSDAHGFDGDTMRGGIFRTCLDLWQPRGIAIASGGRETLASAGVNVDCLLLPKVTVNIDVSWQVSKASGFDRAGPFGRPAVSSAL